ncbi:MAG: hypothetical protein KatS3mg105_4496 [Gemmatales bacterium]|nr:MAG: hypothetical protein KatS3mg105_4496 [Gemmatales bacterium]
MDAATQTVESICNLLIRSRLLQASDVQLLHRRWRLESRDGYADVERFAKWLVQKQYITEYQSQSLLRGHADHFFLNQYKLLDRIGKGRMAGIFKAVHNLGHVVAIKVLPPSKAKQPEIMSRFQREARMAMRLKHPYVVRTFHLGHTSSLHYLVMEYLEGETLEDVLKRRGKLPAAEAVRLIHQALLGLQHIHEQGLVHRDLEPANLMLVGADTPDSTLFATVKILDIGLGRELFDENENPEYDMQLTTEGTVLGSPDYLAPEQARNAHAADIRADIYSLGCVLYHALAGQEPFPEKSAFRKIILHAEATPRPLREFDPSIPAGLEKVVSVMMAKNHGDRYQTPLQAAQALAPFLPRDPGNRISEKNPQMQSYLQWVESQTGEQENSPPAGASAPVQPMSADASATTTQHITRRDIFFFVLGAWLGATLTMLVGAVFLYFYLH